jgi:hypothetical protein
MVKGDADDKTNVTETESKVGHNHSEDSGPVAFIGLQRALVTTFHPEGMSTHSPPVVDLDVTD